MDYVAAVNQQAQAYYYTTVNTYNTYQRKVYEDPWFWLFIVFAIIAIIVLTLYLLKQYRYYTKPYIKKKPSHSHGGGSKKKGKKHPHVTHFDAADPTYHSSSDSDGEHDSDPADKYLCHKVFILNGSHAQLGSPLCIVTWAAEGEKCQQLHIENCHGDVQTYNSSSGSHPSPCENYAPDPSYKKKGGDVKKKCGWCTTAHPAKVAHRRQCTVWEVPTIGNFWASSVFVRICFETECLTTEWYCVYITPCRPDQPVIVSSSLSCLPDQDSESHQLARTADFHHHSFSEDFEDKKKFSDKCMCQPEWGLFSSKKLGSVHQYANPSCRRPVRSFRPPAPSDDDVSVWAEAVVYDALRGGGDLGVKFELVCISCDNHKKIALQETQVFVGPAPSCPARLFAHWHVDAAEYDWCFLKVFIFSNSDDDDDGGSSIGENDITKTPKSNFCALLPIHFYHKEAKNCPSCERKCHHILC